MVQDPYTSNIGKLVFKKLNGISDRNECCRQLLRIWNRTIVPKTPVEGLAPHTSLDAAQVVLHGIGAAAGDVLLRGDYTLVPDLITSWPSIWIWIQLLHAEHLRLRARHDSTFDIIAARQRYSAVCKILASFTGSESELLHVVGDTPGYISMITSLWIEEIRDPRRDFRFEVSYLLAALISCARWTKQVIEICGGHAIDVVTLCLERIAANLQLSQPDYLALNGDFFIIISGSQHPNASFHRAVASSSKCIPVITEAMSILSSPSSQLPDNMQPSLLSLCELILSIPIRLGGFHRVIEAMKADMLLVIVKSSAVRRLVKDSQDIISTMLRYDLPAYFVHRPVLSLTWKALRRIDSLGLESSIIRGGQFEQSWSRFKELAESWLTTKNEFKTRLQSRFFCGNPECEELEFDEEGKFLRCAGCTLLRYCSKQCQRRHWDGTHRKICKDVQERHRNITPVAMSNSDLKFLGNVLARDYLHNGKHIDLIKEQHLEANKNLEIPPHLLVTFDYICVPVKIAVKALTPLAFCQMRNESESGDDNSDGDEWEEEEGDGDGDSDSDQTRDESGDDNSDGAEWEKGDGYDDGDSNNDEGESSQEESDEYQSNKSDGSDGDGALGIHQGDIAAEWHDALWRGASKSIAVHVFIPRGEVPQVMTALLRPADLEGSPPDNQHAPGDGHISDEGKDKWVGISWIHST